MYIPSAFEVTDLVKITEIISANSFATIISKDGDSLFASQLPFLYKPMSGSKGTLLSHMAKASRHWQLFKENEPALVIFQGPHAYISPSWYVSQVAVPTWNYATVHLHGVARIMDSEEKLNAVLNETVEKHESHLPNPWTPNLPGELRGKLLQAIVGFEIEVTLIEAKFKFGQNRSRDDQEKMIQTLRESGDAESIRLAGLMEREFRI